MSLLDGLIKISVGVTYKVEEGLSAIKKGIGGSYKVILNNIPVSLLRELLPLLKGKDVSVALKYSGNHEFINGDIGNISYHNSDIGAGIGSERMQFGCIVLPKKHYDITWNERGIRDITGVEINSCLKCDFRINLCEFAKGYAGGVYIGTLLDAEEGIRQIKEDFKKSSTAVISYIPYFLVEDLLPLFSGKDIRILMPYGHRIHPDIKNNPNSRIALKLIRGSLKIYGHKNVVAGGICFPHIHYGMAWKDGKIIEIRTVEVKECIRCLAERHIAVWSLGKRIN